MPQIATVLATGQETVEPVGQSSQEQPIIKTTPMQDHHFIPDEIVDLLRQVIPQNETVTENFADVVAEVREYYEYHQAELTMPNVKGSLKNHLEFFKTISASKFVLDVIANGYKLPFLHIPKRAFFLTIISRRLLVVNSFLRRYQNCLFLIVYVKLIILLT